MSTHEHQNHTHTHTYLNMYFPCSINSIGFKKNTPQSQKNKTQMYAYKMVIQFTDTYICCSGVPS